MRSSPTLVRLLCGLLLAAAGHPAPGVAQGPGAPLAAQACLGCHGPDGAGQGPIPRLAGRPAADIEAMMRAFRSGEPPGTIMSRIARGYADAEIAAIAAQFAAQR